MNKPPLSPHSTATLTGSESFKQNDIDLDIYDIHRDSDRYELDVPYTPRTPSLTSGHHVEVESTAHGDDESIISMYATKHHSVV